jgi:uncharacterized RDD family membrane protein YckC
METGTPPTGPQSPAPGPEGPPAGGYTGPVPPGGWEQPLPPQHVYPGTQLASWGSRVGATLLDGLILLLPTIGLIALVVGAFLGSDVAGVLVLLTSVLIFFVVTILYAPLLMARGGEHNGQTFGKQAVGIRVLRDTGEPFDVGWGFLREFVIKGLLFGVVGSALASIPTILDWLWPLWDDQNRALHDMVASTHVVRA